jgi:hypothetical protein
MNEQPQPRAAAKPSRIVAALCGVATFVMSFAVIGVALTAGVAAMVYRRLSRQKAAHGEGRAGTRP